MTDTKHKLALILGFLAIVVLSSIDFSQIAISLPNAGDQNVTTKVNVTHAMPEIDNVKVDQNILLNAGTYKTVYCNVSLHDWDGYGDIANVNATLWDNNSAVFDDADDNNTHYTNTTCRNASQNGYYVNYTCGFNVWYYANNGTNWICNTTVIDYNNFTDNEQNTTSIQAYYALNVTSPIDFGDMVVAEKKNNVSANITNFGNRMINVSVSGFGVTPNDGLAMKCTIRNITLSNLKYSLNESNWDAPGAISLTGSATNITGLTVPKRTTGVEWNQTYWHLYIPPSENPFGVCNGTVIFTAWSTD